VKYSVFPSGDQLARSSAPSSAILIHPRFGSIRAVKLTQRLSGEVRCALTKQRSAADQSLEVTVALAIAVARLVGASHPTEPVSFSITHVEDTHPQIIHIYNLDDGPHAIVLARAQSQDTDSSQPIRIFNALGEGVQEIVQPLK
jgi:hypothetical protein